MIWLVVVALLLWLVWRDLAQVADDQDRFVVDVLGDDSPKSIRAAERARRREIRRQARRVWLRDARGVVRDRMRKWKLVAGLVGLVALISCENTPPPPTIPNIYIGGDTINIGGTTPGTPGTTPSPGANCSTVASNRVGFFGIGCPSGVSPRNGQGVLPLGCIGFATQTPKNAQGQDVPAAVHGPVVAWATTTGAERVRLVEVEEAFNRNVIPQIQGDVVITGTVTPPSCGPVSGTLGFQVTAATSSRAGDVIAARAPVDGDVVEVYSEADGRFMGFYRLGDPWPEWLRAMDGNVPPPFPPSALDGTPMPPYPPPAALEGPWPTTPPPALPDGQEFPPK